MKTVLTIFFSTLTLLTSGQSDVLTKKWIAVFSRPIGDNWYSPIDGVILDIKKETVTIGYVFSDSLRTFALNQKSKKIRLDDKLFGKIHFVSNDSLVLDFDKRMRTRFVPIQDFKPSVDSINLTRSAWQLKWSNGDYSIDRRIEFSDEKWDSEGSSNVAITHEKATKYKYQENEKWALKKIHDEWFLTLTQGQTDPIIYQVVKSYGDTLKLQCLSWAWVSEKQFTLHMLRKLEQPETDSIIKHLSQKKWETIEILNYSTSFSEDSTGIDEKLTTGYYVKDTTLIRKSDLISKKISFNFRPDFVFEILVESKLFWQTKWRLSNDGKYVIINEGQHPYDYIEIISLENKELVIGKADNFATDNKREYFPYYYEVRLR